MFSTSLPSADKTGHTEFNPSLSSTWKAKSGYTWDISYGDGSSASGTVGTDTVTIGGVTVTGQAGKLQTISRFNSSLTALSVEIATEISSEFVSDTGDNGLVGLAFDSINTG